MIKTTVNKAKESSKDSWMTSQTKTVNGNQSVIKTTANRPSMGSDSVTKNIYTGHFSGGDVITDKAAHMESHTVVKTVA